MIGLVLLGVVVWAAMSSKNSPSSKGSAMCQQGGVLSVCAGYQRTVLESLTKGPLYTNAPTRQGALEMVSLGAAPQVGGMNAAQWIGLMLARGSAVLVSWDYLAHQLNPADRSPGLIGDRLLACSAADVAKLCPAAHGAQWMWAVLIPANGAALPS